MTTPPRKLTKDELEPILNSLEYDGTVQENDKDVLRQHILALESELGEARKKLTWLEGETDGCKNCVVLVHNFDRYGSCDATISHALAIKQDSAMGKGKG